MPTKSSTFFQDSISSFIEHIIFFHDHIIIIISINFITIFFWVINQIINPKIIPACSESNELEIFWTSIPLIILLFISIPSILILYITEENQKTNLTIKTIRNQWYWSYEYPELKNLEFDRFIQPNLKNRLLSTNNKTFIPSKNWIRIITSRNDVIHSWAIPSISIKIDSIPGRLNSSFFIIKRSGILTGQCSEICGINHRFIPIIITSINPKNFIKI